ncbi:MAG TPA: cache domain-containing protein [Candidatus Methylomirabilis sp.]|nr:cache domain-containing protein [Candidatus Methylomirabilis sp.]
MSPRRGWSLRTRTFALLLATLIPLGGLGVIWLLRETEEERIRVTQDVEEVAALVAADTARLVSNVQGTLAALAGLPAVRDLDHREAGRLFRDLLARSPNLENIGLTSADGTIVASAVPVPAGAPIRLADRDWFQAVMQSGLPAIGGFQISRVARQPVAVIAHPVMDPRGRPIAVASAAVRLAGLSQEIAPAQIKHAALWAVVDRQGLVLLLHSQPWDQIGKPLRGLDETLRVEAVPRVLRGASSPPFHRPSSPPGFAGPS